MPQPTTRRATALAVVTACVGVGAAGASGWDEGPTPVQIITLTIAMLAAGWTIVSSQPVQQNQKKFWQLPKERGLDVFPTSPPHLLIESS